jgi:DNA-binding transcriptional regulator YhcF (GntR family)
VPRQRTQRVHDAKTKILNRIREGFYRPGDRFLSNRGVAKTFNISFQTAQRLVAELCEDGYLRQKASSGTFIAGARIELSGVQLLVSERTKSLQGVISRLFSYLREGLENEGVSWSTDFIGSEAVLKEGRFPVFCDCPAVASIAAKRNYALLLDDAPPAGLEASYIDSIAADDFSGGACAAQLMVQKYSPTGRYFILAGPTKEAKTLKRISGFRSILPQAKVISAESWFYEDGLRVAHLVVRSNVQGVFCCNDHLAHAVIRYSEERGFKCPPLVGFDNDPLAEELNLTTIEIPERKMVELAIEIIRKRLQGDSSSSIRQILSCRPIVRGSL